MSHRALTSDLFSMQSASSRNAVCLRQDSSIYRTFNKSVRNAILTQNWPRLHYLISKWPMWMHPCDLSFYLKAFTILLMMHPSAKVQSLYNDFLHMCANCRTDMDKKSFLKLTMTLKQDMITTHKRGLDNFYQNMQAANENTEPNDEIICSNNIDSESDIDMESVKEKCDKNEIDEPDLSKRLDDDMLGEEEMIAEKSKLHGRDQETLKQIPESETDHDSVNENDDLKNIVDDLLEISETQLIRSETEVIQSEAEVTKSEAEVTKVEPEVIKDATEFQRIATDLDTMDDDDEDLMQTINFLLQ